MTKLSKLLIFPLFFLVLGVSNAQYRSNIKAATYQPYGYYDLYSILNNKCDDQIINKRVVFVGAIKSKAMKFDINGENYFYFQTPKQREHFNLTGLPIFLSAKTLDRFITNSKSTDSCENNILSFCLFTIAGRVTKIYPKNVGNWYARMLLGKQQCIIDVEKFNYVNTQDRTSDGIQGAIDGAMKGFEVAQKITGKK